VPAHRTPAFVAKLSLFKSFYTLRPPKTNSCSSVRAVDFQLSTINRLFMGLPPLAPLFAAEHTLVSFIFNSLQPLFAKQGGGCAQEYQDAAHSQAGGSA
jgi:hypothetical protein